MIKRYIKKKEKKRKGWKERGIDFWRQQERVEFQNRPRGTRMKTGNETNGQQVSLREEKRGGLRPCHYLAGSEKPGVRFIWFAMRNRQKVACNEKVDAGLHTRCPRINYLVRNFSFEFSRMEKFTFTASVNLHLRYNYFEKVYVINK